MCHSSAMTWCMLCCVLVCFQEVDGMQTAYQWPQNRRSSALGVQKGLTWAHLYLQCSSREMKESWLPWSMIRTSMRSSCRGAISFATRARMSFVRAPRQNSLDTRFSHGCFAAEASISSLHWIDSQFSICDSNRAPQVPRKCPGRC